MWADDATTHLERGDGLDRRRASAFLTRSDDVTRYRPTVYQNAGVVSGAYGSMPKGLILHGSRSGHPQSPQQEFDATRRYAMNEPNGYGWSITSGPDALSIHMSPTQWGWNARGCSPRYLAIEFAQSVVTDLIGDEQVRPLCWWLRIQVFPVWPALEAMILANPVAALPTHAELDGTAAYGGMLDGKTDVHPRGARQTEQLRSRILARLADPDW